VTSGKTWLDGTGFTQFSCHPHVFSRMEWAILYSFRKHSPDGVARARWRTSGSAYYSIYRTRKDERLSWPSWMTYSGHFTHISGHPSATGRAWDRESLLVKDRHSTPVQHSQLGNLGNTVEKNYRVFSLLNLLVVVSKRHVGSKTSLQQNPPVFTWRCRLTQDDCMMARKWWCVGQVVKCLIDGCDCGRLKLNWWRSQARRCLLRCPMLHARYCETSVASSSVCEQFVAWFLLL